MAPDDMLRIVDKARRQNNDRIAVTERGTSFGYHNLVVDMRSFFLLQQDGIPVLYDVTPLSAAAGRQSRPQRRRPSLRRTVDASGGRGWRARSLPGDPPAARRGQVRQRDAARPAARGGTDHGLERHPADPGSRRADGVTAPSSRFLDIASEVLATEAAAIEGVIAQLDERFVRAVEIMRDCAGRIVCTGMGKSGHVMKKISATLSSTGTPSFFLHPAEAIHGDLGMIVAGDVVLAASFSGGTEELLQMLDSLREREVPCIAITGSPRSRLAREATVHLSAAIDREACPHNLAPTASTTATLALGDALAMALIEARGFTPEQFAHLHPGGELGRQLRRIDQLMHGGDDLPSVREDAPCARGHLRDVAQGAGNHRDRRRRGAAGRRAVRR